MCAEKEKKRKKADNTKSTENGICTENSASDYTENLSPQKKIKVFSAKEFRKSFQDGNLNSLKQFVNLCSSDSSTDYALQYIEAGGNCVELLHLLGKSGNENSYDTIFEAFTIVLLKIQSNCPQFSGTAEDACRYLFNNYLNIIHTALSKNSQGHQRNTVLKLLTAIVTLSTNLAKEVLLHINFETVTINTLIKHKTSKNSLNVRLSFVHFLLSFLIEGDSTIIKILLEKKGVLTSIIPGLMYDDVETVSLVLSTLKQNVLENKHILKTTKLYTFNTGIVKNVVDLYNWKGPKYYRVMLKKKDGTSLETFIDRNGRQEVQAVVHEFLLVLCTSHKYGVLFQNKSFDLNAKKQNPLLLTVINGLSKPWENKFASELIVKIACACPELFKTILTSVEDFLTPRVSVKWLDLINFLKNMFQSFKRTLIDNYLNDFSLNQFNYVIETFCMPTFILKSLNDVITSDSKFVIENGLDLLFNMLESLNEIMTSYENIASNKNFKSFKQSLNDYLVKCLPKSKSLLKMYFMKNELLCKSSEDVQLTQNLQNTNFKITILNILTIYQNICKSMLDDMSEDFFPEKIIESSNLESDVDKDVIILKTVELFLSINSSLFRIENEHFNTYFKLLCQCPKDTALKILFKILNNVDIFENASCEIYVWLNSLFKDPSAIDTFLNIVATAHTNLMYYNEKISEISKSFHQGENETENIDDLFDYLEFKTAEHKKTSFCHVTLSPMILAVTEYDSKKIKANLNFFSNAVIDLLHLQTNPNILIKILSESKNKKILWNEFFNTNLIPIPVSQNDNIISVYRYIFDDSKDDVSQVVNFETIDEYEKLCLFRMITSILIQLTNERKLYKVGIGNVKSLLVYFIDNFQKTPQLLLQCLQFFYLNATLHNFFVPLCSMKEIEEKMITELILYITQHLKNQNYFMENLLVPYQEKLFFRIIIVLKKYKKKKKHLNTELYTNLIETFIVSYDQYLQILETVTESKNDDFISEDNNLSIVAISCSNALNKLTELYKDDLFIINDTTFDKIINIYIDLTKNTIKINTELLESAIFNFLKKFPHLIENVASKLFDALVNCQILNKTLSKLASFLLTRNKSLVKNFSVVFDNILSKKELLFPLLLELDDKDRNVFMQAVYNEYEHIIQKILEKPQKIGTVVCENYKLFPIMIEKCMPVEKCQQFALKTYKFDVIEKFNLEVFVSLYHKIFLNNTDINSFTVNYLSSLMQMLINCFKRDKNTEISEDICIIINNYFEANEELSFQILRKSTAWNSFIKVCLKHGLQTSDCKNYLLRTLTVACDKLFNNNEDDTDSLQQISQIHEMTVSHSEFLNIILNNTKTKSVKTELLQLLIVLVNKNKKLMSSSHVPIFLAAFNGTLETNDKLVLRLMNSYETSGVSFYDYRPYIWGDFAANYYSVKTNIETLLYRQPTVKQVLDLLDFNIVMNTIRDFDIYRSLNVNEIICIQNSTINEKSQLKSVNTLMTYDPAFYLPLFSQLLTSESFVRVHNFTQSGALALTIIALASECKFMRQAAAHVLGRFYFHLEADRNVSEKKLWIQFVDSIRNGLMASVGNSNGEIKMSNIVAIFFARSSLILTQPSHALFMAINNYLTVKRQLNFLVVPEILQLFHSPEVEYSVQRLWILDVIKDGLKTENDFISVTRSFAYKFMMDFYFSVLADRKTKLTILKIIKASVLIPKSVKLLIYTLGLNSWLYNVIQQLTENDVDYITVIIHIVSKICSHFEKDNKFKGNMCNLLNQLLLLSSKINVQLPKPEFALLIKNLYSLYSIHLKYLSLNTLNDVIDVSTKIIGSNDCKYMLKYGCNYVDKINFSETVDDENQNEIKRYLRYLTILWIEKNV